eukprot:TCALIF_10803-PB protein Name:"Protein of unknown function" AED:0.45 eAED:1.00 QI:0/0/0/1/0/0/3/0/165
MDTTGVNSWEGEKPEGVTNWAYCSPCDGSSGGGGISSSSDEDDDEEDEEPPFMFTTPKAARSTFLGGATSASGGGGGGGISSSPWASVWPGSTSWLSECSCVMMTVLTISVCESGVVLTSTVSVSGPTCSVVVASDTNGSAGSFSASSSDDELDELPLLGAVEPA